MARVVRVTVANPTHPRKGKKMAKKKRKRAKRAPTTRKRRAKRVHAQNPTPRKRRRARRANPKRRHSHARTRHAAPRRRRSNPRKRHKHAHRRTRRRNPGMPVWASAAVAGALGLVGYGVANAGAYALTQRLDPTLATVVRNRRILGGLVFVGGLALAAFKHPYAGAGLAAGGAAVLAGTELSLAVGNVIDLPIKTAAAAPAAAPAATATPATVKGLGAVYAQNLLGMGAYGPMQGYAQAMNAVYAQNLKGMGAVYAQNLKGYSQAMGDFKPAAPWQQAGPFGY